MPIYPLPIRRPSSILQVARDGVAEEHGAVFILDVIMAIQPLFGVGKCYAISARRPTDSCGFSMASAQALLSELALRITSVRPNWYLRV